MLGACALLVKSAVGILGTEVGKYALHGEVAFRVYRLTFLSVSGGIGLYYTSLVKITVYLRRISIFREVCGYRGRVGRDAIQGGGGMLRYIMTEIEQKEPEA